jgi:hypothetical protein
LYVSAGINHSAKILNYGNIHYSIPALDLTPLPPSPKKGEGELVLLPLSYHQIKLFTKNYRVLVTPLLF